MLEVAGGCKDRNVVLCSLGSTSRLRDRTLADASGRKPTNPRPQSPGLLCRRGDLNPHALTGTGTLSQRVCQFRHSDVATRVTRMRSAMVPE